MGKFFLKWWCPLIAIGVSAYFGFLAAAFVFLICVVGEAFHTWTCHRLQRFLWSLAFGLCVVALVVTGSCLAHQAYWNEIISGSIFAWIRTMIALGLGAGYLLFSVISRHDPVTTAKVMGPVFLFGLPLVYKHVAPTGVLLLKGLALDDGLGKVGLNLVLHFHSFPWMMVHLTVFALVLLLPRLLGHGPTTNSALTTA